MLLFHNPLFALTLLALQISTSFCQTDDTESLHYYQRKYTNLFKSDVQERSEVNLPDLSEIVSACPKTALFQSFNENHRKAVQKIQEILYEASSTSELFDLALVLRQSPEINQKAWYNAVTARVHLDPELQYIKKPSPAEVMPDNFINSAVLKTAYEQGEILERGGDTAGVCGITLDERFGEDNGIENRLWYYREDIMINAHHWYFHLVPFDPNSNGRKGDRRGEMFYYLHKGLLARYNAERLSNGLPRLKSFDLVEGAIIEEGYNPHLSEASSGHDWTVRPDSTILKDYEDDRRRILVSDMVTYRNNIMRAIRDRSFYVANGSLYRLDTPSGIDDLADIVERSRFSLNPGLFGNVHNSVHNLLGYSNGLPGGVMLDVSVGMRDPTFYRWHKAVQDIFDAQKQTLPPYLPNEGQYPLLWKGIHLKQVKVIRQDPLDTNQTVYTNELKTFWSSRTLTLSIGLDFERHSSTVVCVKHLNHVNFQYEFTIVKEEWVQSSNATIRIFLAPRFNETGGRFSMEDQIEFFFPLDTFKTELQPGQNKVVRNSTDSTLTIPWQASFDELVGDAQTATPYCGCGFPQHLLLPKGNSIGMTFDLFAMITNADEDAVMDESPAPTKQCHPAPMYCGILNRKYPDSKPMGYPFDRVPYTSNIAYFKQYTIELERQVPTLDHFTRGISNMGTVQVGIVHEDVIFNAD